MKKFSIIAAIATLFTLLASLMASSACFFGWYQPEEPKTLKNK